MKKKVLQIMVLVAFVLVGCTKQQAFTIYMVGDSTMADRYDTIETPERGWGQVLPTFLDEKAVVKNHAKCGRSTKSFLVEGRWKRVMKMLNEGDVVIIQFGHNDEKDNPILYSSPEQYANNLLFMIRQAKAAGAFPILCTPIARRHFKSDTLEFTHGDYPNAAKAVAKSESVPLVDMTAITRQWLAPLGEESSRPYFVYKIKPGEYSQYPDGKTDNTHLRQIGAIEVAKLFSHAVKEQHIQPLESHIILDGQEIKYTKPCKIN